MATVDKEVVSILNNLIETCKDGQHGFHDAADGVNDPTVKALFNQYSVQRQGYAEELQTLVASLGASPETHGSIAGATHRGWINLKSALTGKDEAKVISEAERGEDVAKDAYQEALRATLPTAIRTVVERQYQGVIEAHDRVRNLERTFTGR